MVTYCRGPLEIRDDLAIMLVDEFSHELKQLNITLDDLLEMDHYEIDDVRRKVNSILRSHSSIVMRILRYDRYARGY